MTCDIAVDLWTLLCYIYRTVLHTSSSASKKRQN